MAGADCLVITGHQEIAATIKEVLTVYLQQLRASQAGQPFPGRLLKPAEVGSLALVWRAVSDEKIAKSIEKANPLDNLPDEVLHRIYQRAIVREVKAKTAPKLHLANGNGNGKPHKNGKKPP